MNSGAYWNLKHIEKIILDTSQQFLSNPQFPFETPPIQRISARTATQWKMGMVRSTLRSTWTLSTSLWNTVCNRGSARLTLHMVTRTRLFAENLEPFRAYWDVSLKGLYYGTPPYKTPGTQRVFTGNLHPNENVSLTYMKMASWARRNPMLENNKTSLQSAMVFQTICNDRNQSI